MLYCQSFISKTLTVYDLKMFGMNPASLVLIAALFCCTVGTVPMHDGNSILKWINVQKVNLADLEPAGSELNTWLDPKIYVARTFHGAGTVPGKYVDKRAMFYYTQDGIWHETRQCEVRQNAFSLWLLWKLWFKF